MVTLSKEDNTENMITGIILIKESEKVRISTFPGSEKTPGSAQLIQSTTFCSLLRPLGFAGYARLLIA